MVVLKNSTFYGIIYPNSKNREISYDKLWKMLIDEKMNRTELKNAAWISSNIVAKLGRNEFISMESLYKICFTLNCNIGDIVDIIPESACLQNDLDNSANERG